MSAEESSYLMTRYDIIDQLLFPRPAVVVLICFASGYTGLSSTSQVNMSDVAGSVMGERAYESLSMLNIGRCTPGLILREYLAKAGLVVLI